MSGVMLKIIDGANSKTTQKHYYWLMLNVQENEREPKTRALVNFIVLLLFINFIVSFARNDFPALEN